MNNKISELAEQIRELEAELAAEIQRIRIRTYEIRDRTIHFRDEVLRHHRTQVVPLWQYLRAAKLKHVLTAPIVWLCLVPAVLLDLVVSLYQWICFSVYGIPKVRRADFLVIDRHHLAYLNLIEKLNCLYCSYFNGVIAYAMEVGGRTEQYWCPIKHAARLQAPHSRYARFSEYGDSDAYREGSAALRKDFGDLIDQHKESG